MRIQFPDKFHDSVIRIPFFVTSLCLYFADVAAAHWVVGNYMNCDIKFEIGRQNRTSTCFPGSKNAVFPVFTKRVSRARFLKQPECQGGQRTLNRQCRQNDE